MGLTAGITGPKGPAWRLSRRPTLVRMASLSQRGRASRPWACSEGGTGQQAKAPAYTRLGKFEHIGS